MILFVFLMAFTVWGSLKMIPAFFLDRDTPRGWDKGTGINSLIESFNLSWKQAFAICFVLTSILEIVVTMYLVKDAFPGIETFEELESKTQIFSVSGFLFSSILLVLIMEYFRNGFSKTFGVKKFKILALFISFLVVFSGTSLWFIKSGKWIE